MAANGTSHYNTENCTSITDLCPVEATIYGYYPNLGANIFFAALFGLCTILQLGFGVYYKTWTFLIALFFGCLGETVGYVGRIILNDNPWSDTGFEMQICCLIIAPAFIAAGVYLTLKHFTLNISPALSVLRPRLYTWIFILCDLLSLILQGAGGGIAASSNGDQDKQDIGNDLMMAGIVWQVITLLIFGALVGLYALRVYSNFSNPSTRNNPAIFTPHAHALLARPSFKLFLGGMTLAYITIFTRCVYRIAEMANGWRNEIMQDETDFIVLDGVMIAIATLCLTVWHPGWAFPEMQGRTYKNARGGAVGEKSVSDVESSPERGAGLPQPQGQYTQRPAGSRGALFGGS